MEGIGLNVSLSLSYVNVCVWKLLKLESVCVWKVQREPPTKPRTTMRGVSRLVAPSLSLRRGGVRSLRSCLAPRGFRLRRARISVGSRFAGIVVPRAR